MVFSMAILMMSYRLFIVLSVFLELNISISYQVYKFVITEMSHQSHHILNSNIFFVIIFCIVQYFKEKFLSHHARILPF